MEAQAYLAADPTLTLSEHTVGSLLRERARDNPDRLAVVGHRHGGGDEVRLTYADLVSEAERVATALTGITEPGDLVALWAPNVVEWPIIQYGAALAGVVLVALNPVLRRSELEYAVDHSGCSVLLHADRSRDYDLAAVAGEVGVARPGLQVISLTDVAEWMADAVDPVALDRVAHDPDSPAMLQYTSGTTGKPKGVLLRHRSLVNVSRLTMEFVGVPAHAVTVNPLPMFHTAGCVIATLGPLWVGGTVVLIEQFVPGPVLDVVRRESVQVLFFVPAILSALLDAHRAGDIEAPRIPVVMGGASNVSAALIEAAETTFGASVVTLYGQTELAPVLTATRPADDRTDQLTTVGHPLPGVDVKVIDPETGETVAVDVPGEICARGYQQLVEYLHDPAATAGLLDAAGFVRTGDLGSMDARGYLKVSGRLKDLIIRGGENISPAEIESRLADHPAVAEATMFGLPDAHWGEVVAVALRLAADVSAAELADHCRTQLAPFKVPSRWYVAGDLPTTPTGKVQKFKLPALVISGGLIEIDGPGL